MGLYGRALSEREKLELYEERLAIYERDKGICQYCGKRVAINEFQVAHLIANTKWARKKYGDQVIDSTLNKVCTHAGACNDLVQVTNKPMEREALVQKILEAIKGAKDEGTF